MSKEEKGTIYVEQELGGGVIRYVRIITMGSQIEYDECIMDGKKVLDFNAKKTDKTYLDEILKDPKTRGCPVIVFHEKTGLPIC